MSNTDTALTNWINDSQVADMAATWNTNRNQDLSHLINGWLVANGYNTDSPGHRIYVNDLAGRIVLVANKR